MLLSLILFVSSASAAPLDCNEAKKHIEIYGFGLKSDCVDDKDCVARAIDPDTCATPSVFRKDVDLSKDAYLHKLQEEVKQECAKVWANRAPCKPAPVHAACIHKICQDKKPDRHRE